MELEATHLTFFARDAFECVEGSDFAGCRGPELICPFIMICPFFICPFSLRKADRLLQQEGHYMIREGFCYHVVVAPSVVVDNMIMVDLNAWRYKAPGA